MKSDKELYNIIDKILWEDWDPIGMKTLKGAPRNEYHGYIPEIFSLTVNNASIDEITNKLIFIETVTMGFEGPDVDNEAIRIHCKTVAEKIIAEKRKLIK